MAGRRGAPPGNRNATKNRPWTDAVRRALKRNPQSLNRIADRLIADAIEGDKLAIKEISERIEGKVPQPNEHTGANGGPVIVQITPSDADVL